MTLLRRNRQRQRRIEDLAWVNGGTVTGNAVVEGTATLLPQ
ncbi:hypothetical protein AAH979_37885 [Plantactinospora sp. ZYX-F-223]